MIPGNDEFRAIGTDSVFPELLRPERTNRSRCCTPDLVLVLFFFFFVRYEESGIIVHEDGEQGSFGF